MLKKKIGINENFFLINGKLLWIKKYFRISGKIIFDKKMFWISGKMIFDKKNVLDKRKNLFLG